MNARFSLLRARTAPTALAAAVALAFGLSAPVQAQYTYPGTASSSGHAVKAGPARAEPRERPAYGAAPAHYGYGNPSMQRGEACPPGSNCAPHGSTQQANGGGASPSGGYGAHGSYGYAAPQSAYQTAAPASHNAITSPVRASAEHGAMNYGPSAVSNANFRNSVSGKTSGPNVNTSGQQTSFNGPNGKKVSMDGSQTTFTGPNGQKQTIGGGPDLNNIGGGYGQQKGSGIKQGMSYSADGNGSMSGTRTGGTPGMASAGGMNMGNGGTAGVSEGKTVGNFNDTHNPDGSPKPKDTGKSGSGSSSSFLSGLFDWGGGSKPADSSGSASHRGTGAGGAPDPNAGSDGIDRKSGVKVAVDPPKKGNKDTADMGPTAGPGEIVSGTGQVVQPGKHTGQDGGGGQGQDSSGSNSGGRNAQGQYIAPSGQDNVKKPKEVGTLKMDYNGKNGAIDPKLNGTNGGGG